MKPRLLLLLALGCHLVLATAYLFATPVFEAPDEPGHFNYAGHLLQQGERPLIMGTAEANELPPWREASMAHHPPLYYQLLAGTQRLLGIPDVVAVVLEPRWRRANAEAPALRFAHGADEVAPRSQEVELFLGLRAWSVLFGLVSIALVYRLGRLVFPSRPAVAGIAALLLACLPTWSFTHGVLDNGNLATTLALLCTVLLAEGLVRGSFTPGQGLLLGLSLGLALVTKLTAIVLLPLAAAAFAFALLRWREQRRATLVAGLLALAVAAAIAAPFFLRNLELYGDPLATEAHLSAYASNALPPELMSEALELLPRRLFESGLASFGWGDLGAPPALVWAGLVALVLALAGWLLRGRRLCERDLGVLLLLLLAALMIAAVVRYNTTFVQPQGRYLFPAYGPILLLVAAGLVGAAERLAPALARPVPAGALALLPPLAAALVLGLHFAPAFALGEPWPDPHFAVLVEDLGTPRPAGETSIELLAPAPGATLSEPPVFRWQPPAGVPEDARYTLHLFTARGFVLGSYELGLIDIDGSQYQYPAEYWQPLPAGEPIYWKIRRLPDRSAGEGVADVEESPAGVFLRD